MVALHTSPLFPLKTCLQPVTVSQSAYGMEPVENFFYFAREGKSLLGLLFKGPGNLIQFLSEESRTKSMFGT